VKGRPSEPYPLEGFFRPGLQTAQTMQPADPSGRSYRQSSLTGNFG
jgi:hypothetical protein